MKSSEILGTRHTAYRFSLIGKKFLVLMLVFLLSFSSERERGNIKLAQTYFYRGYIEYTQGNYRDALLEFSRSYTQDMEGYYGELSYLYIGASYAQLSYRSGRREGVMSAIAYLNMYSYHYKKPTYSFLQKEFMGDAYLLLGLYDKAKDLFLFLYRDTGRIDYLLNFLYADALSFGNNYTLMEQIDPNTLVERRYLYHLTKAFYAFNKGMYGEALKELVEARHLNRYVEENPDFLYRYAVSSFMERDWKGATFYFEQLDRKDVYKRYADSTNYYLAFIYLISRNYTDAKKRLDNMLDLESLKNRLILSQLWLFPDFLEKYARDFKDYKRILAKMAWADINSVYSLPAILGVYYYTLKTKNFEEKDLLRLKRLSLPQEVVFQDIRVDLRPMLEALRKSFENLNPYGGDADFISELYGTNPNSFSLLFGYEKLARAVIYLGKLELKDIVLKTEEPLRSFFQGQVMLIEGSEDGLKLIEKVQKELVGEDRQEAIFILGLYRSDVKLLEGLLSEKISERIKPYLEPALLELGDFYYSRRGYAKAKEYYKRYLEMAKESELYWLVAYKLAKAGELTGDRETINWVVKRAEGKDNIISRVIIALWG